MECLNETTAPLFHRHLRKCPDRFWGKLRPKRQCWRLAFFLHLRLAPQSSSSSLPLPSSALRYTDDGDAVKVRNSFATDTQTQRRGSFLALWKCVVSYVVTRWASVHVGLAGTRSTSFCRRRPVRYELRTRWPHAHGVRYSAEGGQ